MQLSILVVEHDGSIELWKEAIARVSSDNAKHIVNLARIQVDLMDWWMEKNPKEVRLAASLKNPDFVLDVVVQRRRIQSMM